MAEAFAQLYMMHDEALLAHRALERATPVVGSAKRRRSAQKVMSKFCSLAALMHCAWPIKTTSAESLRGSLQVLAERVKTPTSWAYAWPEVSPQKRAVIEALIKQFDDALVPARITESVCRAWTARISAEIDAGFRAYESAATRAMPPYCSRAPRDLVACACSAAPIDDASDDDDDEDGLAAFIATIASDPKQAEVFSRIFETVAKSKGAASAPVPARK